MKQLKLFFALFLSVIVIAFSSCTKTGPAGATGATGPAGPKGDTGPAGAAGAQGDTGVANVKYSQWINITWNVASNNSAVSNLVSAPAITTQILDSGMVLVYMRADSSSIPFSLPYTQLVNGSASFIIQASFSTGGLSIIASAPPGRQLGAADYYPTPQVRYVVVPPGIALPTSISYDQLTKMLNIEN